MVYYKFGDSKIECQKHLQCNGIDNIVINRESKDESDNEFDVSDFVSNVENRSGISVMVIHETVTRLSHCFVFTTMYYGFSFCLIA